MLRRRSAQGGGGRHEIVADSVSAGSDHEDAKGKSTKGKVESLQTVRGSGKVGGSGRWNCINSCCWMNGWISTVALVMMLLYRLLPGSLPEYVAGRITGPPPDPPGVKLAKEGVRAFHPVVFVPGIVTGGLELWEGRPCADGLFRKRLWGGTFGEVYKRPSCWVEHMALNNITGLDPEGIRVRAVSGLVAADYFAPGYFVWAVIIENLAKIGYEEKSMYMADYDWRLSFQNSEIRDKSLTRMKRRIEVLKQTNEGRRVVVIPHSMGSLYFLHFLKWVEEPLPTGGGGGPNWVAKHIKATMNIAGTFLGVPKALPGLLSAEAKGIAVARSIAPDLLDSGLFALHTLRTIMSLTRTWDATMSMIPRGGETIWGTFETSPDYDFNCSEQRLNSENMEAHQLYELELSSGQELPSDGKPMTHYGRLISFGKEAMEIPDLAKSNKYFEVDESSPRNVSCGDWIEYDELDRDKLAAAVEGKAFTAEAALDLLRFVAPRMMQRADANWAYGIADDLDDEKYKQHKYWSNPLETKLPNAPDMEMYCLYGVGVLTERSYVYKLSPRNDTCSIPVQIDASANDPKSCLHGGAYLTEGDETVPTISTGLMCAKAWRGKTRFNPANSSAFTREYKNAPPASLLEGRGTMSGGHVDIMGNYALIEDIMRVAAGASGDEIGGDRIYSDLLKWAERIPLKL